MNKSDFFKKNDEKFLPLGFEKDETDPMFFYVKSLVSEEAVKFSESIVSKWLITVGGLAKYRLAQMLNYSTKACGGILPNHCYKPFFLGLT